MILVVGLGNPGPEYARTRHNAGFVVADRLAARHGASFHRTKWRGVAATIALDGTRVDILKPQTFMNGSGYAVHGYASYAAVGPVDILVVQDDLDLAFGKLRFREGGSSGGNNGVRSIIDHLRTDAFHRLKIGIGRPPPLVDAADYVLSGFTADERAAAEAMFDTAVDAVEAFVRLGPAAAANQYNR